MATDDSGAVTAAPFLPFADSRFADVGALRIHYRVFTPEPANPANHETGSDGGDVQTVAQPSATEARPKPYGNVLLLHGLGGSTITWEDSARALCDTGFQVIVPDLPAFGYSERKTGLNLSQASIARWMWRLLDQTCDGRSADNWILVGYSMGASVVVSMVKQQPQRVGHVVFVDGAVDRLVSRPLCFAAGVWPFRALVQSYIRSRLINAERVRAILRHASGREPDPAMVAAHLNPLLLPKTVPMLADLVRRHAPESPAALRHFAGPVDAIWGGNDRTIPVRKMWNLKKQLPQMSTHVIPDALHIPMETHRAEFHRILRRILLW